MKSYVDMKTPVVNEVHLALHGRLWHLLNPQLHEVMSSLYLNMICLHVDAPYLLCATLDYTCRKIFCFCSYTCSYRYRIRSKNLWCRRESRMILVLEIYPAMLSWSYHWIEKKARAHFPWWKSVLPIVNRKHTITLPPEDTKWFHVQCKTSGKTNLLSHSNRRHCSTCNGGRTGKSEQNQKSLQP